MKELWSLIPVEYRRRCVGVALLVPVKALLDLVGVAALVPVMMLVLDPGRLAYPPMLVIGAMVLVIIVKIALSLAIVNFQNRFLMSLYRNFSSRLFVSLYSRGLQYIKNHNSARMTFNVIGVCYNFVMGYLGGWMRLVGEIVFVTMLFAGMMVYSPKATLLSLVAFVPAMLIYAFVVRKPTRELSRQENEIRREQNRTVFEAFKGYSEIRVNNAFHTISKRFNDGLQTVANLRIRNGIIQSIPSYLLELSVIAVVALMLLTSLTSGADNAVFLGVCAVCLLKLMPAVRTIISAMSSLNSTSYTREIIDDISADAEDPVIDSDDAAPLRLNRSIRVSNLCFAFKDDGRKVIEDLDLIINKGERVGIKGRTGAGKTTLFNILLGLYKPTSGTVMVDDIVLDNSTIASWHKIIGYVPQEVFVADTTILENVALGADPATIDRDKVAEALRQASLDIFVQSLPDGVDTKIGEAGCRMSGGQRQRLGIARALYKDASVLFFDEATSSLDETTELEVNEAIASLSRDRAELTIIVISHRESTLAFCDRIIEL